MLVYGLPDFALVVHSFHATIVKKDKIMYYVNKLETNYAEDGGA